MRLLDLRDGESLAGRAYWAPEVMIPSRYTHIELLFESLAPVDVVVTIPSELARAVHGRQLRHALVELRDVRRVRRLAALPDPGPWVIVVVNPYNEPAWVEGEALARKLTRARRMEE